MIFQHDSTAIGILIIVVIAICIIHMKQKMSNNYKDMLQGMWVNRQETEFLYIDKNKGYIVMDEKSGPITIKTSGHSDKIHFSGDGSNLIKKNNKVDIDFKLGRLRLLDNNNKTIELFKDC